jgi:hypothetical protein
MGKYQEISKSTVGRSLRVGFGIVVPISVFFLGRIPLLAVGFFNRKICLSATSRKHPVVTQLGVRNRIRVMGRILIHSGLLKDISGVAGAPGYVGCMSHPPLVDFIGKEMAQSKPVLDQ